jgi:hypothetical protein
MPKSQLEYSSKDVHDWRELVDLYAEIFSRSVKRVSKADRQAQSKPKWVFRGQQREKWELETSLDRAFARYGIREAGWDHGRIERERRAIEKAMLRSFIRRAYHYVRHEPSVADHLEWLAIMRHYGAPTRMLDWTYSFYVAVYNAIENWPTENLKLPGRDGWPVVWALDTVRLKKESELSRQEARAPKGIDETRHRENQVVKYLMENRTPLLCVYSATGFRLNERLIAQQGTFLIQGTLAKPFHENLRNSLGKDPKKHLYRIRLKIDGERRDKVLCELNNMHINHATLYPDLEGFAKSLERHMAYPENWGLAVEKQYGG